MKEMSKLKACVVGVAGAVVCSVLAGVSLSSIQTFLFQLDVDSLVIKPFFYAFLFSFVGFAGSIGLIVKKPSYAKSNSNLSKSTSTVSPENVGSSGASGFVTLMAGTKLQNGSGTTIELGEPCLMWPKYAEVSEEPKTAKKTTSRRFFERVD